jgi:two-component system chemotaxis response regulator CheB
MLNDAHRTSPETRVGDPTSLVQIIEAIVIGASAGAVENLSELLPSLSAGLRVPVIVVVHVPEHPPSMLPQLFAGLCAVPVREPVDKQAIEAGTVWFAPQGYHLLVEADRSFALSVDAPVKFSRPSIDVLFESAADAYAEGLAAVVLSGASDDGAEGARAIRRAGGFVLVQEPRQALARTMPEAAIELADPQFIGSLSGIATTLRHMTGASP